MPVYEMKSNLQYHPQSMQQTAYSLLEKGVSGVPRTVKLLLSLPMLLAGWLLMLVLFAVLAATQLTLEWGELSSNLVQPLKALLGSSDTCTPTAKVYAAVSKYLMVLFQHLSVWNAVMSLSSLFLPRSLVIRGLVLFSAFLFYIGTQLLTSLCLDPLALPVTSNVTSQLYSREYYLNQLLRYIPNVSIQTG